MESRKKSAKKFLCIALVMLIVCGMMSMAVETHMGKTKMHEVKFVASSGVALAGSLYVPENATKDTPAPGIVVCHGMYCERALMEAYYTELARRGYVVLAYDMPSHGASELVPNIGSATVSSYDAVKFVANLPYVDKDKVGITGHSLGGSATSTAVTLDNANGTNYVKAALINSTNPTYTPNAKEVKWGDVYGARPIGLIASHRDEMGFNSIGGSKNYIDSDYAQSFLHFGKDPTGLEKRANDTYYYEDMEGGRGMRIVYTDGLYMTHGLTTIDPNAIAACISFFEDVFGAPNPISAGNQIWAIKKVGGIFGCVALIMFLISFTTLMLFTPAFSDLRAEEVVKPRELKPADKKWFWTLLLACPTFSVLIYLPLMSNSNARVYARNIWSQSDSFAMGLWTMVGALFMLALMVFIYFMDWKKQGVDLEERGIRLSWKKLFKTVELALLAVAATYVLIFVTRYFFHIDFRIFKTRILTFSPEKLIKGFFPYGLMFITGMVASAVANNCFNYKLKGEGPKAEMKNLLLCCVSSAMPSIILVLSMYGYLFLTGDILYTGDGHTSYISWMVPMIVSMPTTIVIGRKLYQVTKNPYLPGIISGIMMTMMKCMQTLTWV